jgi:hypothetical protein
MTHKRTRLWNWTASLLLAGVVGLSLLAWLFWDPHPQLRVKDGSTLTVMSVTDGPALRTVLGPVWMQRVYPLLTPELHHRLGWRRAQQEVTSDPVVQIAFLNRGAAPRPYVGTLIDRHGCQFHSWGGDSDLYGRDHWLCVDNYPLVPRGERQLTLWLESVDEPPVEVGRLRIANPISPEGPSLLPVALPAVRRGRKAQATLRSAVFGRDGELRLTFDHCGEWRPMGLQLQDARGSRIDWSDFWNKGERSVSFPANLCRNEAGYRIRVVLTRRFTPHALPDKVWWVHGVSLDRSYDNRGIVRLNNPQLTLTTVAQRHEPWFCLLYGNLQLRQSDWAYRARAFVGGKEEPQPPDPLYDPSFGIQTQITNKSLDLCLEAYRTETLEWVIKPRWQTAPSGSG